ncbi:MAG: hypothetical protein ACOZE5_18280 [Verrucomicrobiota bacterium]
MNAPRSPLQVKVKPFSVPLLFLHEHRKKKLWGCGGTALLWQTVVGRFLVGAAHVWLELVKQRDARSGRMSICAGMGERVVSLLEAEPVDLNEELDLVVLRAPPESEERMGKRAFYRTNTWPLPPARDGETVGALGYPGELRTPAGFRIETNSFYYENTCAVSARGMLIGAFQAEPPDIVVHVDHPVEPVRNFGGMSGAPVFTLRDGQPVWVGVLKRGAECSGIEAGLQATPCHFIQADGTIRAP